ncbi:hypothetical protein BU17DRAFT_80138 [Hysterangium stoloniferum]|nr:hypothetical protein BU17DRAFT_80138 [Hysterangium stoloniferum]
MPVLVPPKPPSHPVIKPLSINTADASRLAKQSTLHHLLSSLPEPPVGPPPAFTNRETWIKSLPPSRRYKLRQDALASDNIANDPSPRVQANDATSPNSRPLSMNSMLSPTSCDTLVAPSHDASGTISAANTNKAAHAPLSNGKPWPPSPPRAIKQAIEADERRKSMDGISTCDSGRDADDELSEEWTEDEAFFAGPAIHRQAPTRRKPTTEGEVHEKTKCGAFEPVIESDFDGDVPLPPFDGSIGVDVTSHCQDAQPALQHNSQTLETNASNADRRVRKLPSPIPTTITPTDMVVYKKRIAEPMSVWVADYIWKVVTHGMSLPPEFVADDTGYGALARAYPVQPPDHLSDSIRTLLCATLLQPSAIFLALWYIARFPVFFGIFSYDPILQNKEYKFRLELLGEGSEDSGSNRTRQLLEAHAPFRLFLLGVMLANKWLDDNTFSNKTWHQVSGVPMRALNRLESLGLDLLSHDLSLLPQAWSQWLEYMQNYHRALAPYPEPIGPPKDTPHYVIRCAIEELIAAGAPPLATGVIPEPIFLGLAERRRDREHERLSKEQLDILNVDLDEDGPLRDEYLPKRQGKARSEQGRRVSDSSAKVLPPPAEWSPAADPPIHRTRPVYEAVQRAPPAPILAHAHPHVIETQLPFMHTHTYSYPNRTDASLQDHPPNSHVRTHGRNASHDWTFPHSQQYSGQFNQNFYRDNGYSPQHNAMYSSIPALPSHNATRLRPWSGSTFLPIRQHSLGGYHSSGTFDAPPASELFRPTWLRT